MTYLFYIVNIMDADALATLYIVSNMDADSLATLYIVNIMDADALATYIDYVVLEYFGPCTLRVKGFHVKLWI